MNTKIKESLKGILAKLKTVGLLLWSKGVAMVVLVVLMFQYMGLDGENPTPFAELIYVAVLVVSVCVIGPVIRLLVFEEVAVIAESGGVGDLMSGDRFKPMQIHYWFSTGISYLVAVLCVSSLL